MPASWVARLAPDVARAAADAAASVGATLPGWLPLSIDPGGSEERLVFIAAVGATFVGVRLLVLSGRSTPFLVAVATSTVSVAISYLVHRMLGASAVYGLYRPSFTAPFGPILNPNNLAGFMALGLPLCAGLGLRADPARRWLWWFAGAVVASVGLLTGSRAGNVALAIGPLSLGALYYARGGAIERRQKRRRPPPADTVAPAAKRRLLEGVGVATALVIVGFALARVASDNFVDTNYQDWSKVDFLRSELAVLFDEPLRPWLGVGRGGFSVAFAQHFPGNAKALFAECLPLQLAIEFGLPLTILLIAISIARVAPAFWSWRSPAHLGGLIGLGALLLQNLLDFGLELSGIAVPAAACLAAALPRFRPRRGLPLPALNLRAAGLVTVVICGLATLGVGYQAARDDRLQLERRLSHLAKNKQSEDFWRTMTVATLAHPADPTFATLAAGVAVLERKRNAGALLNRAMLLAPSWGRPHLWAAHWLYLQGHADQAVSEFALAAETESIEVVIALCAWLGSAPSAELVFTIAPTSGPARAYVLNGGARCLGHAPAEAARLDEALLADDPGHVEARTRRVRLLLTQGAAEEALLLARDLRKDSPSTAEVYIVAADAELSLGNSQKAIDLLEEGAARAEDRSRVLTRLAWVETAGGSAEGMRHAIDQLRMAAGSDVNRQRAAALLLGQYESALGNNARALKALREAVDLGAGAEALAPAAELAQRLGQLDFARETWDRLCRLQPNHPRYCEARNALMRNLAVP
jgi:Flp pilus assembly protein TadD